MPLSERQNGLKPGAFGDWGFSGSSFFMHIRLRHRGNSEVESDNSNGENDNTHSENDNSKKPGTDLFNEAGSGRFFMLVSLPGWLDFSGFQSDL